MINILHHIFFWTGSQLEDFRQFQGVFVYTRLHTGLIWVYTNIARMHSCIGYYDNNSFSFTDIIDNKILFQLRINLL